MPNIIGVTRTVIINCPADVALPIVWDIQRIEQYEPKVFSAQVQKDSKTTGSYIARGFFAFLPWQAKFSLPI